MTKFKCVVCDKVTISGRLPKGGDGTFYYPRRHKVNGRPCEGNTQEAEWIDSDDPAIGSITVASQKNDAVSEEGGDE